MNDFRKMIHEETLILLVEESPTQLIQLQHTLENKSYKVVPVKSGEHALAFLEKEVPSVVISDIVMQGINGYELCKKIKENDRTSEIPVILLTSLSNPEDVLESLACGADNFVTKPYSNDCLLYHVEQILTNKRLSRNDKVRIALEINFFGKRRMINADQQQILSLLLSTYEAVVIRNKELTLMQEELESLNDNLEGLVKERTHELKAQQERYLDLFNNAPVMFFSFDPTTGNIVECNDTLLRRTGFSRDDVINTRVDERFFPEQGTGISERFKQFSFTGSFDEIELPLITKLGTDIPVLMNVSALRSADGRIIQGRAVFQDITGIKRAQEEVKQSKERYRAVTDSAVDAIITLDSSGLIVGWNMAAERIFGFSETEMNGQPVNLIIPIGTRSSHQEGFIRIQQGGEARLIGKTVELKGLHKSGEEFPIELSLASWKTEEGRFFTGIIRDITSRKNSEEELLQAKLKAEESDKLKSAFLANMSHEIRTPMNGIIGFMQLLDDTDITPEERTSFIEIIKNSSNRLLQVITDIVDISKIETGLTEISVKEFNIVSLIHEILSFYKPKASAKKLTLEFSSRLNPSKTTISSDPERLRQALSHLIDNGLKFTSKGGVTLNVEMNNQILICKITDTGIGIDPKLHERIFDRFRQAETDLARKYGGTGLGLSLAKSYIEMLGGNIWLMSEMGKGSTFVVEVPVKFSHHDRMEEQKQKDESAPQPGIFENFSVLIAEDEPDNATYLKMLLERYGMELFFASTGEEAIDVCRKHPELSFVLMDVKMPVMDGLEATRIIRKFRHNLPIVATTAFALGSDRERCLAAGCNEYISKPIRKEILLETIKTLAK